jgi:hypothetical protein
VPLALSVDGDADDDCGQVCIREELAPLGTQRRTESCAKVTVATAASTRRSWVIWKRIFEGLAQTVPEDISG